MMATAAVVVHVSLSKTRWGRSLYAIGGNREAARLSGVNLTRSITLVFTLSGLLAGFASIINISRASVASMDSGIGLELDAVAATVVGGTSLFGGQGGIPGTIIGAFLIYTIRNGCQLSGLGNEYQRAIIGAVVILAVLYDRFGPGRTRLAS
jgi:ribose/xylose/arabinose/galactoside ABC-type transport system permease subunit